MAQRMKGKNSTKAATDKPAADKREVGTPPPLAPDAADLDGGPPSREEGSARLNLAFVGGLAEIASREGLSELKIRTADALIIIRRGVLPAAGASGHGAILQPAVAPSFHPSGAHTVAAHPVPPPFAAGAHTAPPATLAATSPPPPAPTAAEAGAKNTVNITSPFVGTFYSSPSPETPPFAEVGQRVKKGQVLCIVEAMKLMNEIEAEIDGTIVEVLVENAQPVEYGQTLFKLAP